MQALILLFLLLLIGLVGWFALKGVERVFPSVSLASGSWLERTLQRDFMRRWIHRHPRLAVFIEQRLDRSRFSGLAATMLGSVFIYLIFTYLDSVFDFVGSADVTQTDEQLADTLFALRDPGVVAVLGWFTALGSWMSVLAMLAGVTGALLVLGRSVYAFGLWLTVIGNQVTVTLLKTFFDRPRSDLGYFVETSGSFPSGHAASSIAIWGMVFYLACRLRFIPAAMAALMAAMLAGIIGLSRIYLIEHYLSDVLNGYLVGGLWLVFGIAFCEWRYDNFSVTAKANMSSTRRQTAILIAMCGLIASLTLATQLEQSLNVISS